MKQSSLDLNVNKKKTFNREFLSEMERVMPWSALVELISPHYPEGGYSSPRLPRRTCCAFASCSNVHIAKYRGHAKQGAKVKGRRSRQG